MRGLGRIVAWAVVVASAAGCASSTGAWTSAELGDASDPPVARWIPSPQSATARADFDEARRLLGLGRTGDAFRAALRAADAEPGFLEAHRLVQDLAVRTTADWWLRQRYDGASGTAATRADAVYLRARIEPDPLLQLELFRGATELDPTHPYATLGVAIALARRGEVRPALAATRRAMELAPWLPLPWIWLAGESLKRDDAAAARRFFAAARERAPDDVRAWLGLAQSADMLGDRTESTAAALETLRLAPGDPAASAAACDALVRAAARSDAGPVAVDLDAGRDLLDRARADGASAALTESLAGRLELAAGRASSAVSRFERAMVAGAPLDSLVQPLRLACVLDRRYVRAVEASLAAAPPAATAPSNLYAPRWARLARAASAASANGPSTLLELAEAMLSVGWMDEGRSVLELARAAAPEDAAVAARAEREAAFRDFLADVAAIARSARAPGGARPSVEDVLASVGEASRRRLGFDASSGAVVRRYALLGTFAVSLVSGGAFETAFGSHGLVCLVGARAGSPTELVLGRIVVARADSAATVDGVRVAADECWLESEGLAPDVAGLRRGLAGLTLDRLVLLQLDAVRGAAATAPLDLPFARRPAATRDELLSLDTPSAVSARIEASLGPRARADGALLDGVRRHELVHVLDAARLLPIAAHPFAALAFAAANGFSGAATERALESRAQAVALAEAREPRLALAALLAFLPAREGETPHTAAYRAVAAAAVAIVADDPAAFPSIDRAWNVLQQMDRLGDDEVRELGRRLARTF